MVHLGIVLLASPLSRVSYYNVFLHLIKLSNEIGKPAGDISTGSINFYIRNLHNSRSGRVYHRRDTTEDMHNNNSNSLFLYQRKIYSEIQKLVYLHCNLYFY